MTTFAKLGYNKAEVDALTRELRTARGGKEANEPDPGNDDGGKEIDNPDPKVININDLQQAIWRTPADLCTGPTDPIWLQFYTTRLETFPQLTGHTATEVYNQLKDTPIMQA